MKKHIILALVPIAGTVVIAGCTSSSSPSPSPSPGTSAVTSTASQNSIAIQNTAFSPSTLTIQKGANVTWKNEDSIEHRVLSSSNSSEDFSSPVLRNGDTYTYQFNNSSSFPYHCTRHLYEEGTIVVE